MTACLCAQKLSTRETFHQHHLGLGSPSYLNMVKLRNFSQRGGGEVKKIRMFGGGLKKIDFSTAALVRVYNQEYLTPRIAN